jgi:glutamine---fructose-6-phosphate transaminase (isomerizing)
MSIQHDYRYRPIRDGYRNILVRIGALMDSMRAVTFHWGHRPARSTGPAVVLLPASASTLHCGLAGLITVYGRKKPAPLQHLQETTALTEQIMAAPLAPLLSDPAAVDKHYLQGDESIERLIQFVRTLRLPENFLALYREAPRQEQLKALYLSLEQFTGAEAQVLNQAMGHLAGEAVEIIDRRMENLKDVAWCIKTELIENISKVQALIAADEDHVPDEVVKNYRNINTVLNSLDRLEVRGRDSAGISLLFLLDSTAYTKLKQSI